MFSEFVLAMCSTSYFYPAFFSWYRVLFLNFCIQVWKSCIVTTLQTNYAVSFVTSLCTQRALSPLKGYSNWYRLVYIFETHLWTLLMLPIQPLSQVKSVYTQTKASAVGKTTRPSLSNLTCLASSPHLLHLHWSDRVTGSFKLYWLYG